MTDPDVLSNNQPHLAESRGGGSFKSRVYSQVHTYHWVTCNNNNNKGRQRERGAGESANAVISAKKKRKKEENMIPGGRGQ